MNCTLSMASVVELESISTHTITEGLEDSYATSPIIALQPRYMPLPEEELHTQFEQAISDRVTALHGRLSRISKPLLAGSTLSYKEPAVISSHTTAVQTQQQRTTRFGRTWQRCIIFFCLASWLLLLGFDLMGLMVLRMR